MEAMAQPTLPDPPGFDLLSKAEQIRYLARLWDRIVDQPGELPVPESHLALAEQRLAGHRRDPGRTHPALDIVERLSKPTG